jgi:hypothetical protein
MPSSSEQIVVLAGGLSLPLPAVLFVLDLEARGFSLCRDGDHLVVRPASKLAIKDRLDLARWKPQVLAVIDYCGGPQ